MRGKSFLAKYILPRIRRGRKIPIIAKMIPVHGPHSWEDVPNFYEFPYLPSCSEESRGRVNTKEGELVGKSDLAKGCGTPEANGTLQTQGGTPLLASPVPSTTEPLPCPALSKAFVGCTSGDQLLKSSGCYLMPFSSTQARVTKAPSFRTKLISPLPSLVTPLGDSPVSAQWISKKEIRHAVQLPNLGGSIAAAGIAPPTTASLPSVSLSFRRSPCGNSPLAAQELLAAYKNQLPG